MIHQELNLMPHLTLAQNVFIGREPRAGLPFLLDEKQINADTQALFDSMHLALDPRTKASDLTVAKQQMVEIAKALSFNSQVLIMDEPTAALTEAEIDELFRIIRDLKSKGVGIVYISHRLEELKRICDRITVMRDGQYVDTVDAAVVTIDRIISMMVGRTIFESTPEVPADAETSPIVLEVRHLMRGNAIRDVNFTLRKGEILGFAGLMGAGRTEVCRAIFGADPYDGGEIVVKGQPVHIKNPTMRSPPGSVTSLRIANGMGWPRGSTSNRIWYWLPSKNLSAAPVRSVRPRPEPPAKIMCARWPSRRRRCSKP